MTCPFDNPKLNVCGSVSSFGAASHETRSPAYSMIRFPFRISPVAKTPRPCTLDLLVLNKADGRRPVRLAVFPVTTTGRDCSLFIRSLCSSVPQRYNFRRPPVVECDPIANLGIEQSFAEWRYPTDSIRFESELVNANNRICFDHSLFIFDGHRRTERDAIGSRSGRIDYLD